MCHPVCKKPSSSLCTVGIPTCFFEKNVFQSSVAWCHPNCLQESYQTTLTSAELDTNDTNLRDVAVIKVSYQTSSTKVYKMIPQTFGEKICKYQTTLCRSLSIFKMDIFFQQRLVDLWA